MLKETLSASSLSTEAWTGRSYLHRLNQNTYFLNNVRQDFNLQKEFLSFPHKLKTRLALNFSGLNGLATTVVEPGQKQNLDTQELATVLSNSNAVNSALGLPLATDLIIRTASHPFYHISSQSQPQMSEPAMLVKNAGKDNVSYVLLSDNGKSELSGLNEFFKMLHGSTYLMIHDDNFKLQTSSIHGALLNSERGCELMLATDSLHARNLGDPDLKIPTIRINTQVMDDLFKIRQGQLPLLQKQKLVENPLLGYSLYTPNGHAHLLPKLFKEVNNNLCSILQAYQRSSSLFGKSGVMEFRLYPQVSEKQIQRLHVLDVNCKF